MTTNPRLFCGAALAALLLVAACQRSESTANVPAQQPATAAPAAPAPGQPPMLPPGHPGMGSMMGQSLPPGATATAANPRWIVPAAWQQGPPSSFRRGSFRVAGPDAQTAEIAVTVFPGDVGGLLANVNRWRTQIGLGPVTTDQLASLTTPLDVAGQPATMVDLTGDNPLPGKIQPQRMIVAIINHAGNSWFFKLTGDAPLVAAQKETFQQFVKSVKF